MCHASGRVAWRGGWLAVGPVRQPESKEEGGEEGGGGAGVWDAGFEGRGGGGGGFVAGASSGGPGSGGRSWGIVLDIL